MARTVENIAISWTSALGTMRGRAWQTAAAHLS
jgi:hypothetical protein